jgi:hypothetical protein
MLFLSVRKLALIVVACTFGAVTLAQQKNPGYTDTPILPGQKWHVHDPDRPHPPVVTPGANAGAPPSDAVVLFDGKDLSHWTQHGRADVKWPVHDGYFEVGPGTGDLVSREQFGDAQIHIEWSELPDVSGTGQDRGNSGVYLMGRYEVQVLDSSGTVTYADGQAGALYGEFPPLVNAMRKPGDWNAYDIVVNAPRFQDGKLQKPLFVTLLFNGVLAHNHRALTGTTEHRVVGTYKPHGDGPILLQDHGSRVRYRNIWVRRLTFPE